MLNGIYYILIYVLLGSLGLIRVFAQDTQTIIKMMDAMDSRIQKAESSIRALKQAGPAPTKQEKPESGFENNIVQLESDLSDIKEKYQKLENQHEVQLAEVKTLRNDIDVKLALLEGKLNKQEEKKDGEKPKWEPEMKSFLVYGMDITKDSEYENEFGLDRAYVGAKYSLSDVYQFHFLSDVGRESGTGVYQMYAKYAYLKWIIPNKEVSLNVGLQGTTNWKPAEKAWEYRIVKHAPLESFGKAFSSSKKSFDKELEAEIESLGDSSNTNMDLEKASELSDVSEEVSAATRNKTGSSADLGISLDGKFNKNSYGILSVINGSGYKSPDNDKYKNVQIRIGTYLYEKKVHVSVLGEWEPWELSVNEDEMRSNVLLDALLEYNHSKETRIGINAAFKKFDVSNGLVSRVYSIFGKTRLNVKNLFAFARYDAYQSGFNELSENLDLSVVEYDGALLILGVEYSPVKNISIIPNFQSQISNVSGVDSQNHIYLHLQAKF